MRDSIYGGGHIFWDDIQFIIMNMNSKCIILLNIKKFSDKSENKRC